VAAAKLKQSKRVQRRMKTSRKNGNMMAGVLVAAKQARMA